MQVIQTAPVTEGRLPEVPPEGPRKIWRHAAWIALGGFLFGYATGVVSGALLFVSHDFQLNAFEQGGVVSVLLLGAMAAALAAGPTADRLGRRTTLGLDGAVFVVGTAIAMLSVGYWMLIAAMLVLGLAVGAASATVPVYLSEVAPTEIRGRVLTLNPLMITIGILVGYLVNLTFSSSGNWRAMFAIGAVPAVAMTAGTLWLLPESPQWLTTHARIDTNRQPIASMTTQAAAKSITSGQRAARQDRQPQRTGWRVLLDSSVRPALIVGLTLAALLQFSGINAIIYYAPTIIHQTGLTASNSILYSIPIGVINAAMTLLAIRLIDHAGRRRLLLLSLTGMLIALLLLGLSFAASWSSLLSLVLMVLYIAAFAVGMGPVFWVLVGEIFPSSSRAAGSSASSAANWTANLVISLAFLPLAHTIGQGQTFWIFAVVCAFALWFVARYLPETRGADADQVEAALQARFRRPTAGGTMRPGRHAQPRRSTNRRRRLLDPTPASRRSGRCPLNPISGPSSEHAALAESNSGQTPPRPGRGGRRMRGSSPWPP